VNKEETMDSISRIRNLNGVSVVPAIESTWGPTDTLELEGLTAVGGDIVFELLVPTSPNDIWDYVWRSEREAQSTEKVQLFQGGVRVAGSRITAISREGQSDFWDAKGPERYRLTFVVLAAAVKADASVQVRFFWQDKLMSTAGG
jgi:hypothetical protein